MNVGWQRASTLHVNHDKLENVLELSLEGHTGASQVNIRHFSWKKQNKAKTLYERHQHESKLKGP